MDHRAGPPHAKTLGLLGSTSLWNHLAFFRCCRYNNLIVLTFDPIKRDKTLSERGLDFADAAAVFTGVTLEIEDTRKDYGEPRIICYGLLEGRMVVVGYTPRGADRHIFSMRKANEREQAHIAPLLEV
jgi:uncharacterized DUF497 family protein